MKKNKLICITPIDQISNFKSKLSKFFDVDFFEKPKKLELKNLLLEKKYEIIFTNPNQQGFILDKEVLENSEVKIICTASTGKNHIDVNFCKSKKIEIISITDDLETLKNITSTAELAFCLLLTSIRKVIPANESVLNGNWSWQPFLGRQVKNLIIGVIGFGRLGQMFAKYSSCFGAKVLIYDPYVKNCEKYTKCENLEEIFSQCDVISLHVHVNDETRYMINEKILAHSKKDLILINTSRGEIVNEQDVKKALSEKVICHYACDVLENEFSEKITSPLFELSNEKVTFTPHIGGSTSDAQNIAYNRALDMLLKRMDSK